MAPLHTRTAALAVCMCALLVLVAGAGAGTPATGGGGAKKTVMPWMCLERCGGTAASIKANLADFAAHADVLAAVAFEDFNLGPNSTLVVNNLTQVAASLQQSGFQTIPMISSFPYPPQFLDWMRQVWANPDPFIDACVSTAVKQGLSGFNVDWEPQAGTVTPQDPFMYADFLTKFGDALHAHGKVLTVDVASWSHIWNYSAIAASSVDRMMVMSTYADKFDEFQEQLELAVAHIPLDKLSIGLETTKGNSNATYTTEELQARFAVIQAANVQHVSIWKAPVPDNWWPVLQAFLKA